jgi:tRNA/rRNA methyltransferase
MQIINNLSVNNVGFIFGCERIGLTQQQISKCNAILTIPVCAEHMSMNLAQAVAVIAYELNNNEVDYLVKQHQECAKVGEVNFFVAQLFEMLGKTRFIKHEKHQENLLITIRNIMLRANLSKNELQTMHGIIKSLYEK